MLVRTDKGELPIGPVYQFKYLNGCMAIAFILVSMSLMEVTMG